MTSPLKRILDTYRTTARTEREKGTYFEELVVCYLRNEPRYKDLYSDVWTYADWARANGLDARDAGIDLVAKTRDLGEIHAIQCKLYAEDYKLQKKDIDSFFAASGKRPFSYRIIFSTTNQWSEHAEAALEGQQPPVTKIDLHDLETSQIDWARYAPGEPPALKPKKQLREHQATALEAVTAGLAVADRGKMIMACGTGKTFTSLKIAESIAGAGKRVLFLVPSLSLLSQSLTEWTQESATPLHSFAVCSDSDVGKKRRKEDDRVETFTHELRYPATTDAGRLALEMARRHDAGHMSVVFSTYHSIDVIGVSQRDHGLPEFDLVICDEAHRTTGVKVGDEDESNFIRVHDQTFLHAAKRLYMTATPRIYGDTAKATAERDKIALCSMDDETLYGKELYVITFSEAVKRQLLVDYKVIVLAVEEDHVNRRLQTLLKDENNQLRVDDAAKIVGCWKALAKQGLAEELTGDDAVMRRAVAFCQVIDVNAGAKTHKVSSKNIAVMFGKVVQAYQDFEGIEPAKRLICEAAHVDGTMNASQKEAKLDWLKADAPADTCRVLSNVRCLSEGVDVPALDAVLFLTPRNSQVDVVQSVGRVMRNAPGKKRGYVILPVVIPAGVEPHAALNDNKTYAVVWQVLQALRSHDDRFDAMVNKLEFIGQDKSKMEVVAITDTIQKKQKAKATTRNKDAGRREFGIGSPEPRAPQEDTQQAMQFEIGDIERAIYAKLVQKCGNRHHWEDWANDIAKIARTHISRITTILENGENTRARDEFASFAQDLKAELNSSITDAEIVEMLAQHLITRPVFDALFADYRFAQLNPISKAMSGVLDALDEHRLDKEAATLQSFYESVKERAKGIDDPVGKQKIIVELYDKFFRNAFPRLTERLGIVYTPVEVVDFIIHSVDHILRTEFGQTLGSKGVHILDPFVGTGTFITRMLQSGLITPAELPYKYANEIHANELVPLAYYIAAINIEATYHGLVGGAYKPFEGICLTDTFQQHDKDDLIGRTLADNSARRARQNKLDIRVIVGNPPYSVGQESTNDQAANIKYPALDRKISESYIAASNTQNANSTYDSYLRAVRWASDRIGTSGILGFVTNAGWLDGKSSDGLRIRLAEEFSNIYVFHLRGNARTSGEQRRKEKDNVFGSGSRAPIAISVLVKNPDAVENGRIHFYDIGDYLTREEKLATLMRLKDISGIERDNGWQIIIPNEHADWLKQRNSGFADHIAMGNRSTTQPTLFGAYSNGVQTNRDPWCQNSSRERLSGNIVRLMKCYDSEMYNAHVFDDTYAFWKAIDSDSRNIKWTRKLKTYFLNRKEIKFSDGTFLKAEYRPFSKQWLYRHNVLNEYINHTNSMFPVDNVDNKVIVIGQGRLFSALMVINVPDVQLVFNGQCFPLYLYGKEKVKNQPEQNEPNFLNGQLRDDRGRLSAITDEGLAHFRAAYPGETIGAEDIFYYVYGLLHSPEYRERYADNLSKELPRIPCVGTAGDFWAFSKAGRALGALHVNYETVAMYPVEIIPTGGKTLTDGDYRVDKMKQPKVEGKKDLTRLCYNDHITVHGIPLEAYDYVVNGKPALDWVIERQCRKVDKDSGIVNDANDWAIETMNNPRYPLELFQRVITVSLETIKIVRSLPALDLPT